MTAPAAAAPRVIDLVRNDVMYLKQEYSYKNGMKNVISYNGKTYTLTPVCKNKDGEWVQAPGYSRGMFHCQHCGVKPCGDTWEFKQGEESLVLNDADIHQIDQHGDDVSLEKARRIYNFFHPEFRIVGGNN